MPTARMASAFGRQPVEPLAGGHRLAGLGVVPEAAPVALGLDLLVRDGALDDEHERLQLAALGLEEPLDEVVGAADGAVLEVDQRPVHGDLREPGQRPERDLLDAGLGGGGEGDRVAVAAQPGVDPQDVDDGILGRCGHRSAPRGVVPITLARCAVRSKWSRHLPTCCIRPTVRRWARGWRGRWSDAAIPSPGSCRASASAPSSTASPLSWAFPVSSATRRVRCSSRCRATPTRWPRSPSGSWRRRRRSRGSPRSSTSARPLGGEAGFAIVPSRDGAGRHADPARRRLVRRLPARAASTPPTAGFRHPFSTCTNCGPRFTIITGLPYDRPATTMAGFPMCAACAASTRTRPTVASTPSPCAAPTAARP